MNKYIKPEIDIVKFEVCDIIATSGDEPSVLDVWGSMLKDVDSAEINVFA